MGPVDHNRAKAVFVQAIGAPRAERDRVAREACVGDDALLAEVRRLLEHDELLLSGMIDPSIGADRGAATPAGVAQQSTIVDGGASVAARTDSDDDAVPLPAPFGQFRPLGVLGRGAFGVVYRARDEVLGRDVALKVLIPGESLSPAAVERFVSGVRAAAEVRHERLVQTLHAGFHDGAPYLVLELVEGVSLADVLDRHGPLPPAAAASVLLDLCEGVGALHDAGVIHRDIKPANILLDADGRVRITDLGLAVLRPFGDPGSDGAPRLAGTPAYMAPECFEGEVTPRSDVYAIAITAYEMLVGRPPFAGAVGALARQHREDPVDLEAVERAGGGADMAAIIRRATAKRAAQRHRTASHLHRDVAEMEVLRQGVGRARFELVGLLRADPRNGRIRAHAVPACDEAETPGAATLDALKQVLAERASLKGDTAPASSPSTPAGPSRHEARPLVCAGCWYDVSNLDATATCPECGRSRGEDDIGVHGGVSRSTIRASWWTKLSWASGRVLTALILLLAGQLTVGLVSAALSAFAGRDMDDWEAVLIVVAPQVAFWVGFAWCCVRLWKTKDQILLSADHEHVFVSRVGVQRRYPLKQYKRVRVYRSGDGWRLVIDRGWFLGWLDLNLPGWLGRHRLECFFVGTSRRAAAIRGAFRRRIRTARSLASSPARTPHEQPS